VLGMYSSVSFLSQHIWVVCVEGSLFPGYQGGVLFDQIATGLSRRAMCQVVCGHMSVRHEDKCGAAFIGLSALDPTSSLPLLTSSTCSAAHQASNREAVDGLLWWQMRLLVDCNGCCAAAASPQHSDQWVEWPTPAQSGVRCL
jgi:hypothetical protein